MEWHAWQYLINDATERPQGYVRCDMWVKAWSSTGPFEIDVRTSEPNMWNAISQNPELYGQGPEDGPACALSENGSTIIEQAGGPNDIAPPRSPIRILTRRRADSRRVQLAVSTAGNCVLVDRNAPGRIAGQRYLSGWRTRRSESRYLHSARLCRLHRDGPDESMETRHLL